MEQIGVKKELVDDYKGDISVNYNKPSTAADQEMPSTSGIAIKQELAQELDEVDFDGAEQVKLKFEAEDEMFLDKGFYYRMDQTSSCPKEASSQYISYSAKPIEDKKTQDLRKLLSEWNQEFLVEHLVAQKVFVDVLMVIKHHHIERLLKNFKMGTQILFEHKLEEWRQSIGMPIGHYYSGDVLSKPLSSSPLSPPASSCASRASTPPRHEPRFAPYSIPNKQPDNCDIFLFNILSETPKGAMLVEYYNKFLKFQDDQRTSLINLVAQFFEDKGVPITLAISYRLEKEILDRFPNEKLEYYRSSKRGRIYNKYCNLKTSFKAAVGKHFVDETSKKKSTKKCRIEKTFGNSFFVDMGEYIEMSPK
ncbi:unnamed protein product [Brassicogethes aeneus]|uniref:Uncharacterized protein n=1 Tax=Brassicogethes aeneus TaxID=1431903 RepID=A0A9P0AU86_BRAAE|nr:unnamed protein product [Brassicogethes aeneus]